MRSVLVVDYGMGNLRSVAGAVRKVGWEPVVSCNAGEMARAERYILPGVGAFADGMRGLRDRGLVDLLAAEVAGKGKPILGICLGAQLFAREGEEGGPCAGLGWLDARAARIETGDESLRLPHVGWNDVEVGRPSPLFEGLPPAPLFYFVHSYLLVCDRVEDVVATTPYGRPVTAAARRGNVHAVQFHPEKSQRAGLDLLRNFLERT